MQTTTHETRSSFFDHVCRATSDALTQLGGSLTVAEIADLYESPNKKGFGDSAFPCFPLAGKLRVAPNEIANRLAASFAKPECVTETKAIGGYFNVWYNPQIVAEEVLPAISEHGAYYGSSRFGSGRTICMDYSHPNIAKPFGVGHLRSTVIGHALKNVFEKLGYTTVGINHLGDWGTQFGKLIVAFRDWGSESDLSAQPIMHLYDLYVRFHQEAESNSELDARARAEFKKLEDGDPENLALWKRFRDLSLDEFQRVYSRLGVTFDSYNGEAFFNDQLSPLIERLNASGIAQEGVDGSLVIPVGGDDEPPLLLRKSDGATLYATRDIAAAEYRWKTYNFEKCLYIVGSAQALHFKQLFAALDRMGHSWASRMEHVEFGWVKFADGMMSTRKGNIVLLDDVIEEAVTLTRTIIREKNAALTDADAVAEAVGVGAIVFWQLSVKRQKDVSFNWEEVLSFDGRTGPYLQYTHARACSLIRKWGAEIPPVTQYTGLEGEEERRLLLQLSDWPRRIAQSAEHYEPQIIASALLDMAQTFNSFYQKVRILDGEPDSVPSRLRLVDSLRSVMAEGLRVLGLHAPEQM